MVQNLVAVVSLLTGLAGLTLSYAAHRQKAREERQQSALRAEELQRFQREREQERQESALRAEELQRFQREREQERQREQIAQQQRELQQASMISAHIALSPSSLHDSWVTPKVVIQNGSNQPVRNVRVSFCGEAIGEWTVLGTSEGTCPLPPTQIKHADLLRDITVEFTDVAGIRWRREGYGALRRARQGNGGSETSGTWGPPEPPVVERDKRPTGPPSGPLSGEGTGLPSSAEWPSGAPEPPPGGYGGASAPAGASGRRHIGFLQPAAVLVSVVLIAGGIWWLLRN